MASEGLSASFIHQCPSPASETSRLHTSSPSIHSDRTVGIELSESSYSVKDSAMEQSRLELDTLSPPETRNNSAQSSPLTRASELGTLSKPQQQQQQSKAQGRPRGTKAASSSAVNVSSSNSAHSIPGSATTAPPPTARASTDITSASADSRAAAALKKSAKTHGQSGAKKQGSGSRAKDSQPLSHGSSSFEQKKGSKGKSRNQNSKQRRQNSHQDTAGYSKQESVRSTDDDDQSVGYSVHDESEDSEDEFTIGFSQEEWDMEVRGRVVLPTGLEKTLTAQILHTYETRLFPSAESIEVKRAFIEKFATILSIEFPNWEVEIHVFGSSVNGLGTSRSDVDICLTTEHKELENVFVLNKVLRKYGMRTYCVPHARVPIVKSWDPELRIASDINVNNTIALHNTRMIQTFVAIDARVRPFVMAIKNWSKCREINDAAFGGTLSPYAWVNLAINFLQMRNPPILPILHPPVSPLDMDSNGGQRGNVDLRFNDDIDQLRGFGLENTESLGFLLYAFFRNYAYEFDYRHQVVSLRQGCYLTKVQKNWDTGRPSRIFCIEEPFSTWLNLGHSANTTSVEGIRQEFQRAFRILRDGGSYDEVCEVYQRPPRISPQVSGTSTLVSSGIYNTLHEDSANGTHQGKASSCYAKGPGYPQRSSSYSPGYVQTPYGVYHSTPGAMPVPVNVQRRESCDNLIFGNAVRVGEHGNNANGRQQQQQQQQQRQVMASSQEAVENVLPVYLDHVLHPLLRDDQFVTEVYHFDATGKEQGVVFSEMLSRENSESDLASHHLRNLMFAPKSAYTYETGGLTPDIAVLTNQEIIDYHRQYYDSNNLTIVMTGAFDDDFEKILEKLPEDMLKSNGCDSRSKIDCSLPAADCVRSKQVRFPSADTDIGSFLFGWRGPAAEDVESQAALQILLRYLAKNSSSPLNQRFVERPSPLANYASATIENTIPSILYIDFGGVPYFDGRDNGDNSEEAAVESECSDGSSDEGTEEESGSDDGSAGGDEDPDIPHLFEEGYFRNLLVTELERIYETKFDGDANAMINAAKRYQQKLSVSMENKPEEIIQEALCYDIVTAHFSPARTDKFTIGTRARIFDIIDDLSTRPVEYWLGMLKTWLIDQEPFHVAMIPDAKMGSELEAKRREKERANEQRIVDKEAHSRAISKAIEMNKVDLPASVKQDMPSPDPARIISLPHKLQVVSQSKPIGPTVAVQMVEVDSEYPAARLHVPLDDLPDSLRAYLVLFQELLLCSDVVLPAGILYDTDSEPLTESKRVSFITVDNRLADITVTNGASVGYQNSRFTCSWLDELFLLYIRAHDDKFALGIRWLIQVLMFADFTAERIQSVAQNLLSEIVDLKRDGDSVASAVATQFTTADQPGKSRWVMNHISMLEQENVLKQIISNVKSGDAQQVITALASIRNALISGQNGFLSLCVPAGKNGQEYLDEFSREWAVSLEKYSQVAEVVQRQGDAASTLDRPLFGDKNSVFPVPHVNRFPEMTEPKRYHFAMASEQSSHVEMYFKCDLFKVPSGRCPFDEELSTLPSIDFYALRILIALLGRTDGPLYNVVRGKGYAYGAYFHLSSWAGMLCFNCYRASDAPKAILEMQRLLKDVDENWDEYVSGFEIKMTRSTLVYSETMQQSTPYSLFNSCVGGNIFGFESSIQQDTWRNKHIAAVGQDDLRRVFDMYLKKFLDPEYPTFSVITTPLDTELPSEIGVYEPRTWESMTVKI
ncbi:hypothetical protein GGI07_003582 [Coemansia sp. Benny D115]|nr:hypothetical protein GGI07_003582 [Coemansia sp. Benny D115]